MTGLPLPEGVGDIPRPVVKYVPMPASEPECIENGKLEER